MKSLFLILGSILLVVVLFFFIALYIAAGISQKKSQKQLAEILEASPFREKKKKPDEEEDSDEFQARDERKEIVTGKAVSQQYEKKLQKEGKYREGLVPLEKEKGISKDDTTIIDIAKPVGFWSRLIMSQKLGFLMNLRQQMNKDNKHGYFVNLIRAQAKSQSKEKGRGL